MIGSRHAHYGTHLDLHGSDDGLPPLFVRPRHRDCMAVVYLVALPSELPASILCRALSKHYGEQPPEQLTHGEHGERQR
jgi:hypothetical protein